MRPIWDLFRQHNKSSEVFLKIKLYPFVLSLLIFFFFGTCQINAETLLISGWGVRAEHNAAPATGIIGQNTAFHFSPDGSFHEIVDSTGFTLKVGVQIKAIKSISTSIPIDAFCNVKVLVDDIVVDSISNQHKDVSIKLTAGVHNILIVNDCCNGPSCWMGITVGKCLWGTTDAIKFVQTYMD